MTSNSRATITEDSPLFLRKLVITEECVYLLNRIVQTPSGFEGDGGKTIVITYPIIPKILFSPNQNDPSAPDSISIILTRYFLKRRRHILFLATRFDSSAGHALFLH
jgi:hypothetical protein